MTGEQGARGRLVQRLVREHGAAWMTDRFNVKVTRHKRYPNLHMFKYSQTDSPMGEPAVQGCRGLILDADRDWDIVAYPYDKFFNHGEGHAAVIDWATARVLEKLDGSLIILYHYDGAWQAASSGLPDAGGNVNGGAMTFADLFWETWHALDMPLPAWSRAGHLTFMLELMTKHNRIVVKQAAPRIVAHGARDRVTGGEYCACTAAPYAWDIVREYPLQSLVDVTAAAEALHGHDGEGFVVVDGNFNRIKVKSPAYVALSHLKDSCGPRRFLELVRAGETAEVLAHFPEWTAEVTAAADRYGRLLARVDADYDAHAGEPDQKTFAMRIKDLPWAGALFARRAGKIRDAGEWARAMPVERLEKLLAVAG